VAFLGIAAEGRDGFAEVFLIIRTTHLTKDGAILGGGATGCLMVLPEGIGIVAQVNGRRFHPLGPHALQQVEHIGVIAFIFIDRCMFRAVVKFNETESCHWLAPPLFGLFICALFHFPYAIDTIHLPNMSRLFLDQKGPPQKKRTDTKAVMLEKADPLRSG